MDLKSCMIAAFFLFLLPAVPSLSKAGLGSEVYDIDYRGPETHSQRPPPNRSAGNGIPHRNLKKHPRSKRSRLATRTAIKKLNG